MAQNEILLRLDTFTRNEKIYAFRTNGYTSAIRHTHDFIELTYILNGKAFNFVGQEVYSVGAGDLCLMGELFHNIRPLIDDENASGEDFQILNIIFDESVLAEAYASVKGRYVQVSGDADMLMLINRIESEMLIKADHYQDVLQGYVNALVGLILRKAEHNGREVKKSYKDDYLAAAVRYLEKHYAEQIRLDDVAKEVMIAKAYLQRMFKAQFHLTIKEYLIRYRIQQSCKLLSETELSIGEVAEKVGFMDLKHYYNMFKRIFDMTPGAYRHGQKKYTPAKPDGGQGEKDGKGSKSE